MRSDPGYLALPPGDYAHLKQSVVPAQAVAESGRLSVPLQSEEWLADRQAHLDTRLHELRPCFHIHLR